MRCIFVILSKQKEIFVYSSSEKHFFPSHLELDTLHLQNIICMNELNYQ